MIIAHTEHRSTHPNAKSLAPAAKRARKHFLTYYPDGFRNTSYLELERSFKLGAHEKWLTQLNPKIFRALLKEGKFSEIADRAVRIESRTSLLFSFEKMAVRDAVKPPSGARLFAEGLYDFLHGRGSDRKRFEQWVETIAKLPRRQTRVLTWPVATVFGFIAQPEKHLFLKPTVTRLAAERYGFHFQYRSRPNWETYSNALAFAETVRKDQGDLKPKDLIDLQGFIWVQGSDEYPRD
jgi:hypothetical protein